jgi:hypothetical protein
MARQIHSSVSPDESTEQPSFRSGESGDDPAPPPYETMGASYGIKAMSVHGGGRGEHVPQSVPYLMPQVTMRNGGTERVADAIGLTPLGGLMPGPNAIAPAVPAGQKGALFAPDDAHDSRAFDSGVIDGYPEGCPVPF